MPVQFIQKPEEPQAEGPQLPVAKPGGSTPWPVIDAAAGQLSRGQPVTVLPEQGGWDYGQQQAWRAWQAGIAADFEAKRQAIEDSQLQATLIDYLKKNAQANQSKAAVQAAERHMAIRAYQLDLQRGVSPEQALLRHGPRMFTSGAGMGAAVRAAQPAFTPVWRPPQGGAPGHFQVGPRGERVTIPPSSATAAPFEPTEKTLPSGRTVIQTSPNRYQEPHQPRATKALNEFESRELSRLFQEEATLTKDLAQYDATMRAEPGWLEVHKPDLDRLKAIREQLEVYRGKAAGTPAATGTSTPKPGAGDVNGIVAPKTQVEYDAIPKGAEYLDPQGRRRRKK
jgi:hypothetical protein